jgi:hypothetical protein
LPLSDPKKLLKSRAHLKQTITSESKVYQPKSNTKFLLEPLTSQEVPIQPLFGEISSDKLEAKTLKPELFSLEIKVDKLPTY